MKIQNGVLVSYTGQEEHLIIPREVTEIAAYAFHNCDSLRSVTIPDSVKKIGPCAFHGCSHLERISFAGNAIELGHHAFAVCGELAQVILPEGVTEVSRGLFANCKKLSCVHLPESVRAIGDHAFDMCESLKELSIPQTVETIGEGAFCQCESLADKNGFVIVHNVLHHYAGKKRDVTIPEEVRELGWNAFFHYRILTITVHDRELPLTMEAFRWNVKLTVRAPLGSRAEAFAKAQGFGFEAI